jgi:general secretion pathway protein A
MYTAFYGLREKPFALSPDPRFLFLAQSHREALAHLLYGIEQGEGFIAITGEVGTGKTTLCRTLLQRLGAESEVAFVFNPKLSGLELLKTINAEFGLRHDSDSQRELNDALNRFLVEKKRDRKRVLLIIDEAQNLERETLEQVRLLSNLETETSKLIQIVLLGQPELDVLLESPELRQLKQRIGVRWRLRPLSPSETRDYIRHRLRVAAGAARDLFSPAALRELHRFSSGIPRVVNVLCDRALLAGYAAGAREVGPSIVRGAAAEVRGQAGGGWLRRQGTRSALLDVSLATALVVSVGIWFWLSRAPHATQPIALDAPAAVSAPPPAAAPVPEAAAQAEPAPPATDAAPSAVREEEAPAADAAAPTAAAGPAPGLTALTAYAPAPSPAGGSPLAAPAAALPPLGTLLAEESGETSAANALGAVLMAWGIAPEPAGAARTLDDVLGALSRRRLDVLPLSSGDLASLRAMNHPALLRIKAADGVPRLVVLRALDPWQATLQGVGPSGAVRVSAAELEALWGGEAWVTWRDFEALPDVLQAGVSGQALVWLQRSLATLGFYAGPPTGRFDSATQAAVRAFQRSRDLSEDGTVGPRTKMALYDSLGRYAVPRLQTGREVG